MKERWTNFIKALAQHEHGHAKIALAAAEEVRKQAARITVAPNCHTLQSDLNSVAERVIEAHRQKEKEYDRQTEHGAVEVRGVR